MTIDYRQLLIARFRRQDARWPLFQKAALGQMRLTLTGWRIKLKTNTSRPEDIARLRKDLPDCLNLVGRDTAAILTQRPDLAKQIGIDGPGLGDLIDRRDDTTQTSAVAGQISRAAQLAQQDAAMALSDNNQRAIDGLATAYNDPNTPAAERSRIGDWIAQINSLAEMTAHRSGRNGVKEVRAQTEQHTAAQAQPQEVRNAITALGGSTAINH